jgi:hypothetical protein
MLATVLSYAGVFSGGRSNDLMNDGKTRTPEMTPLLYPNIHDPRDASNVKPYILMLCGLLVGDVFV